MDKTFTNFIRTNPILKIKDQKFSNEVIFEEVLTDSDLGQITLLNCDFHKGLSLWRKCHFYDCTFENCQLSDCAGGFYSTRFSHCNFQNLNLKWSKLMLS